MKKIWLIISLNIFLIVIQFSLISLVSTEGERVWQMTQERNSLEAQNQVLKQSIYSLSAISKIVARAEEMNMQPIRTEFWKGPVVARANP